MFFTFKLTARRILVITAAIIAVLLGCGLIRTAAAERGVPCKNDSDRIMWLAQYGVLADPTPVWVKDVVIGIDGADGWEQYCERLRKNGFDISDYEGKRATVHCYIGKGDNDGLGIRVISVRERAVAFEIESKSD